MKRSTDAILTTHAGSLPRPDALRAAWSKPTETPQKVAALDALLRQSVTTVVADQLEAGIAIPNDGEFGKPVRAASDLAAWRTYIFGRLTGFGPTPLGAAAPGPNRRRPADAHRRRALGAARIRRVLRCVGDGAERRLPSLLCCADQL